jgi:hypothetical protein
MPRKPNMSKINSSLNRLKSAERKFQHDTKKAINELKSIERQAKSYQRKLRSSSTPSLNLAPSLYLGNTTYDAASYSIGNGEEKEYDVFISHASEDKETVASPLATALRQNGLSVWYDEFELRIGDSLRRKIDRGIANSNFGIIVVSRHFIKKGWTNYEFDGIISRSVNGEQIMLPIWHDITKQEVLDYSPSLLDKVARNTTDFTIEEIADEISDLIMEKKGVYPHE